MCYNQGAGVGNAANRFRFAKGVLTPQNSMPNYYRINNFSNEKEKEEGSAAWQSQRAEAWLLLQTVPGT